MSRSFRHCPMVIQSYTNRKFNKRKASKTIRRLDEIGNGCEYRRHYPQYDLIENKSFAVNAKSRFFRRQCGHASELQFVPVIVRRRLAA